MPPVFDAKTIILDTETTGFTSRDKIIQIAIINLKGETLLNQFLNPGIPVPADAYAVHGISDDQLKDAPTFKEIYPALSKIIQGASTVIVYNAEYDRRMLDQECRGARQMVFSTPFWCAMHYYSAVSPIRRWQGKGRGWKWIKLSIACKHHEIEIDAHNALGDCLATLALLKAVRAINE